MGRTPDVCLPLEEVFTPGAPIRDPARHMGRERRLELARRVLREPGRHLMVLGEPGVGRTSFALTVAAPGPLRYHTVGLEDTFEHILERLLSSAAPGSGAGGPWPLVNGTAGLEPASVLVIDDLDRAREDSLRNGVLPLVRALSDAGAATKLILVTRWDRPFPASLEGAGLRLVSTVLDRLDDDALGRIVDQGTALTGLRFAPDLRDRIVQDADGQPGPVHALCLDAARSAVGRGARSATLGRDYLPALQGLVSSLGPGLESIYEQATRGRGKTNRYAHLLWAAALSPGNSFDLGVLESGLALIEGKEVPPQAFAVHLGDLLKRQILSRLREGLYRFRDPAMRAYVRLLLRRDHPALMGDDPLQLALPY